MRPLWLVDTTLRDGEQSPGFSFSPEIKLRLARLLDKAGVCQIEAGVPAMGVEERNCIRAIKQACSSALVSTWNRARPGDIQAALACEADIIHICTPVSERQIRTKLGLTPDQALDLYASCAAFARNKGPRGAKGAMVTAGFEDASRAQGPFMLRLAKELKAQGVARIRISDTVGVLTPEKTKSLVEQLAPAGMDMEIHTHNDLGMAEANALCAAMAGAAFVDTTIMGIGERAGNCDMQRFTRLAARSGQFALSVTEEDASFVEREAAPLLWRDETLLSQWSVV
ncbi:MAG: hypothetical protein LBO64_00180 [Desulfovibrio sp.]|nr:hypothetical protein [Desulfovibrio sp.]